MIVEVRQGCQLGPLKGIQEEQGAQSLVHMALLGFCYYFEVMSKTEKLLKEVWGTIETTRKTSETA